MGGEEAADEEAAAGGRSAAAAPARTSAAPSSRRRPVGSSAGNAGGTEVWESEAERCAAARRVVLEKRQEIQQVAERQRQKEFEMAEAYKKRAEAIVERSREARRQDLARLRAAGGQHQASSMFLSCTRSSQFDEELTQDESYRELLDKYGDRLRVPRPPPPPLLSSTDSCWTSTSPRERSQRSQGKPSIPRVSRPRQALPAAAAQLMAPQSPGRTSFSTGAAPAGGAGASSARNSMVPGASAPGAAVPGHGEGKRLTAVDRRSQSFLPGSGGIAVEDSEQEVPEPDRSLMPRKEQLRKKQQALLKKTDVVFYRRHMKDHFRKILKAVELTFADAASAKQQAAWNLAKPTIQTDNLLSPGPRQP